MVNQYGIDHVKSNITASRFFLYQERTMCPATFDPKNVLYVTELYKLDGAEGIANWK